MLPTIGFCGASGSGKTTLVCAVIKELRSRGFRVGAIKHHGHPGTIAANQPSKDTDLLTQAGAERVILAHEGGILLSASPDYAPRNPTGLARSFLFDLDIILVEGFKSAALKKIEVVAPDEDPILPQGGKLVALTRRGGKGQEAEIPVLDADNPPAVCDFLLAQLKISQPASRGVKVWVDGQELGINPFVAGILDATVRGLIQNLKGGTGAERIEIKLD